MFNLLGKNVDGPAGGWRRHPSPGRNGSLGGSGRLGGMGRGDWTAELKSPTPASVWVNSTGAWARLPSSSWCRRPRRAGSRGPRVRGGLASSGGRATRWRPHRPRVRLMGRVGAAVRRGQRRSAREDSPVSPSSLSTHYSHRDHTEDASCAAKGVGFRNKLRQCVSQVADVWSLGKNSYILSCKPSLMTYTVRYNWKCTFTQTCTWMLIAVLLTGDSKWKWATWLSTDG